MPLYVVMYSYVSVYVAICRRVEQCAVIYALDWRPRSVVQFE